MLRATAALCAATLLVCLDWAAAGGEDILSQHHRHRGRPWLQQQQEPEDLSSTLPSAGGNVTTFRWSYFPSYDTMRFVVYEPPATATHWQITLSTTTSTTAAAGATIIAQLKGSLPVPASGKTWPIPALQAGSYMVTMKLTSLSAAGAPLFAQADTLNRTMRPWEGGALGEEDILLPPFTALTVAKPSSSPVDGEGAGTKIGVIARDLTLTGLGLWSSVAVTPPASPRDPKPAPIEILAQQGVELVAQIGGRSIAATATATGSVQVTKATPTKVHTASEWSAGALSGSLQTTVDPDGCTRLDLTLDKCATPISELTLRIPLKLEEAPFMHAVTDLLRFHYAGRVPAGEGEVYNTTSIARYQLPGPLVPYIWVGGAARGVAFFTDNVQDWIAADPAYQLLRDSTAGTLTLVVNLISPHAVPAGGVTLSRQRKITFGLMASPAKPQAVAPVGSPRDWWLVGGATESQVALEFLGADYYWGSQTPCLAFYPFLRNTSVFDWLMHVRNVGVVNTTWGNSTIPMDPAHHYPDTWIRDQWMPLYTPENCESCTSALLFNIYESIQYSANQMIGVHHRENISTGSSSGVSYVVPYTNGRGVIWDEDTANFMDEWTEYDIADPRWDYPALGGGDAPWCKCPSKWCDDVNYRNFKNHTPISCSTASTAANLLRFRRNESAEMTKNASMGRWRGYAYQTDPVKSYADMALYYTKQMLETFADGTSLTVQITNLTPVLTIGKSRR
jgi:hypothetical protein